MYTEVPFISQFLRSVPNLEERKMTDLMKGGGEGLALSLT